MRILFENGKKIGEISDWMLIERQAERRLVLGKEVMMPKPKAQCTFTSPKLVNKKSEFLVIEDAKTRYQLKDVKVKDGTFVTASILETTAINGPSTVET